MHFEGKTVNVSVYIVIEYGCCIPEIALEVQEKVKDAIEAMTGYEVQFVDVNVEGVAKRRESELEKESSSDVDMAEILLSVRKQRRPIPLSSSWLICMITMILSCRRRKTWMKSIGSF